MAKCDHCKKELPVEELYDFSPWGHGQYCWHCQHEHHCPRCSCGRTVEVGGIIIPCPTCKGAGLVFPESPGG